MNETVRFQAQGDMMVSFPINIINDDIVEEINVESYSLHFIGSSPTNRIVLGPEAVVRIMDEDSKLFLYFDLIYNKLKKTLKKCKNNITKECK